MLKDTLKAYNNFKNKQKAYEVMFYDIDTYVYFVSLFNTLYIEIKRKC